MTRAEAIKILNRLLLYCNEYECPHGDCGTCVEAINMAEDALEQQRQKIRLPKHCIVPPSDAVAVDVRSVGNGEIVIDGEACKDLPTIEQLAMDDRAYIKKIVEKKKELMEKGEWTDANRLELMLCDIQPYSMYWQMGMIGALEKAIKLLRESDGE